MDIAFTHLDHFAYIGVFSSGAGLGGGRGLAAPGAAAAGRGAAPAAPGAAPAPAPPPAAAAPAAGAPTAWETNHKADLDNPALKKSTKLIWLSTGVDDNLINTSTKPTVEMLKKHGFNPVFEESSGAHQWINWRNYLNKFAPQLFQ